MQSSFPLLQDISDLSGKTVLLRLDLNLPIVDGVVQDEFRLERSLPTLEYLKEHNARTIILAHTDSKETDSLALVAECLNKHVAVTFVPSVEALPKYIENLVPGGFLFLENIRRNAGEIENDEVFAKKLASFGDVYVNDAFSVSHRAHASVVGITKFLPSFGGLLFAEEISHLSKAFTPPQPFVFILAGANKKLTTTSLVSETKFPLIKKFLGEADFVFVGGALANDLFKAQGYEIGVSKHSERDLGFGELIANPKIMTPVDVVVKRGDVISTKKPNEVLPDENILDAGPATIALLAERLSGAKFVLWNGTLGAYEHGFEEGTAGLAQAIAKSGIESVVGGGDTVTCISRLNLEEKFSFVSTGGGAMLEFLGSETLPAIEALRNCPFNKSSEKN